MINSVFRASIKLSFQNPDHRDDIRPSVNLRETTDCKECVIQSKNVILFTNLVLALTNPLLYETAQQCHLALQQMSTDAYVNSLWHSVFHGISIISNGTTKPHRDTKGNIDWFDILVSVGNVDELCLDLPELQVKLTYKPQTIIAIGGHALTHAVEKWKIGEERACWAFFLRRNLVERFSLPIPSWPTLSQYST